jgi:hypothetical protein
LDDQCLRAPRFGSGNGFPDEIIHRRVDAPVNHDEIDMGRRRGVTLYRQTGYYQEQR